ncbi:hypothetical protein WR164_12590 [Philodulcilactobacillus myokoensis]|uniref:Uncharacterized protein n=1 Tax=Philodulcilactobacillus myokoensis TaxID=2929573 RepID=A0A9W6B2N7_9LACO|nr:protein-export chaperone SecB [Philodulcilactobacillus myokoensis]GLB47280.1 hypothetical protein WR164_12590 [Philodulcilactobacillus myokoensis]
MNVKGAFKFNFNDNDLSNDQLNKNIKDMLALNGNAILYPYIRSLVEDISMKTNTFPAYVLLTINFVATLKQGDRIKFKEINLDK